MKKIVIATDMWLPEVNGVVRAIEGILPFLKKNGFEIVIIHPGLFFTTSFFFYSDMRLPFFPKKIIRKIIEKENPDYIHIVTEGMIGLATRSICLKKKIKFTTAYHGNIPDYVEHYIKIKVGFITKLAYSYFRWFHNSSSKTIVSTESLRQELEKKGFTNVVVCPLGVNTELFKRNVELSIKELIPPIFVYSGRIAVEKNIEEFLKCDLPGTKLIIGSGPARKKLEKEYKGKAVFAGWKIGQELVDMLSLCDVFVFPSKTDTFGFVVVEALACGLPVAAHNVMGPRDIITNGVDGYLEEDLKQAAIKCLNLSREDCRKKALKFSWALSAESFINNLVKVK